MRRMGYGLLLIAFVLLSSCSSAQNDQLTSSHVEASSEPRDAAIMQVPADGSEIAIQSMLSDFYVDVGELQISLGENNTYQIVSVDIENNQATILLSLSLSKSIVQNRSLETVVDEQLLGVLETNRLFWEYSLPSKDIYYETDSGRIYNYISADLARIYEQIASGETTLFQELVPSATVTIIRFEEPVGGYAFRYHQQSDGTTVLMDHNEQSNRAIEDILPSIYSDLLESDLNLSRTRIRACNRSVISGARVSAYLFSDGDKEYLLFPETFVYRYNDYPGAEFILEEEFLTSPDEPQFIFEADTLYEIQELLPFLQHDVKVWHQVHIRSAEALELAELQT